MSDDGPYMGVLHVEVEVEVGSVLLGIVVEIGAELEHEIEVVCVIEIGIVVVIDGVIVGEEEIGVGGEAVGV